MKKTLFFFVLLVSPAFAQVKWSVTNPTSSEVAVRVTDVSGSAEEGFPVRSGFLGRIQPFSTVQFYTPRFAVAVYRFNYEPDVPGWAGYETAAAVYDSPDGTVISCQEGNLYKTLPGPGGLDEQAIAENTVAGFVAGFIMAFPIMLFGLVLRAYRQLTSTNPSL